MKIISMISLIFLIFILSNTGYSQYETQANDDVLVNLETEFPGTNPISDEITRGGRKKTALGTLKTLIVFVRFAGDNEITSTWPNPTVLPTWAQNFVNNSVPIGGSYYPLNLSDFFNRCSGGDGSSTLGDFHLIGDIFYVTTDDPRTGYVDDADVTHHILSKLDDTEINNLDFRLYDNWTFMVNGENYNHANIPDGKLDHVIFIWRDATISGSGGGYMPLIGVNYTTNDGININSQSGSMTFGSKNGSLPNTVGNPAHEYCHYLFGGDQRTGHFDGYSYDPTYWNFQRNRGKVNSFALMCAVNAGWMGAYERYRLGWLNPIVIENNTSYRPISDTHVNNEAIIIPLDYDQATGWLKEFYFIENYHTTNAYAEANPFLVKERFGNEHVFTHGY